MVSYSDTFVATADPPSKGVPNPIHDASGAAAAGYAGALVAGVRTYGWAVGTVARALGDAWRSSGWIDFSLRRPLFAGEVLEVMVSTTPMGWSVECFGGEERRVVLQGVAGLGNAAWVADLLLPEVAPGEAAGDSLPVYDLSSVPLFVPMRPLSVFLSDEAARSMVADDLGLVDGRYQRSSEPVPIHPYFLAARMAPLTRHNYTYGPTIHVRSQIQHRREGRADREITVGAQIVDAYERNGHWYQVLDGAVTDIDGELCRIRHHTIFRPRGT
jgi:hypothetical protein